MLYGLSTLGSRTMSTPQDIIFALRSLGLTTNGMQPHRIGITRQFEPVRDDIRAFHDDLYLIAGKVDRVLEAYGEYLQSLGIVSQRDVKDHFTNVLFRAIDGNATHCIEAGIEERIAERVEEFA